MTREDAYNRIDAIIAKYEIDDEYVTITSALDYDALRFARKLLEQEHCEDEYIKTEVLDKIRAEISDFEEEVFNRPNTDYSDYAAVRHCLEIIDKCKEESEVQV